MGTVSFVTLSSFSITISTEFSMASFWKQQIQIKQSLSISRYAHKRKNMCSFKNRNELALIWTKRWHKRSKNLVFKHFNYQWKSKLSDWGIWIIQHLKHNGQYLIEVLQLYHEITIKPRREIQIYWSILFIIMHAELLFLLIAQLRKI